MTAWWWLVALWLVSRSDDRGHVGGASPALSAPPQGHTLLTLGAEAERLQVPIERLVLAIVMCSERARSLEWVRSHTLELIGIGHTLYNRMRWPQTFGFNVWEVAMAIDSPVTRLKQTTAETGGQFATRITPTGPLLGALLDIAAQVEAEQVQGVTRGTVTHYHHHEGADAARVNASWESRGYVQVALTPTATFFTPGPARARAMR